jgi:hypothetical protein
MSHSDPLFIFQTCSSIKSIDLTLSGAIFAGKQLWFITFDLILYENTSLILKIALIKSEEV